MDILSTLTNVVRLAPELIILGFCIQYLNTSKTTDSVLLTVGTGIGALVMIFYSFVYPSLYDSELFGPGGIVFVAVSFVAWGGQILFAVGLILLMRKAIANWNKTPSPQYKNDPEGPLDSGMH